MLNIVTYRSESNLSSFIRYHTAKDKNNPNERQDSIDKGANKGEKMCPVLLVTEKVS